MGGTQYFLKEFGTKVFENIPNIGTKTVELFWIVKGSENNNVVLSVKETFNSTIPVMVIEEIMLEGMGLSKALNTFPFIERLKGVARIF